MNQKKLPAPAQKETLPNISHSAQPPLPPAPKWTPGFGLLFTLLLSQSLTRSPWGAPPGTGGRRRDGLSRKPERLRAQRPAPAPRRRLAEPLPPLSPTGKGGLCSGWSWGPSCNFAGLPFPKQSRAGAAPAPETGGGDARLGSQTPGAPPRKDKRLYPPRSLPLAGRSPHTHAEPPGGQP